MSGHVHLILSLQKIIPEQVRVEFNFCFYNEVVARRYDQWGAPDYGSPAFVPRRYLTRAMLRTERPKVRYDGNYVIGVVINSI